MAAIFTPTETVPGVTPLLELTNRKLFVELAVAWKICAELSALVTVRFCAGVEEPTGAVNVRVDGLMFRDPNPPNPELIWIGMITALNPLPAVGVSVSVPLVPEGTNCGDGMVTANWVGVV